MYKKYQSILKCLVLITALLAAKVGGAQSNYPCGAVEIQKTLFKKDRRWFENQERTESIIARKLENRSGTRSQDILTIPVVVHVVHNNGAENISDQQINQAIQNLNDAFAHKGYYAGKGNGYDTQIQFCLANRTPANQGTTGINRVVSSLTNMTMETEDLALKNLSRWNTLEYVNIWVVKEINSSSQGQGVAGYAYLAGQHGQPHDGMVCEAKYFGISPSDDVVFIHEMGHYLNLLHTFEGGCKNDQCNAEGDKVCDTPPDQSLHSACVFNSCQTDADDSSTNNPFTTNVNDMTENYMDYSPFECQFAFTKGQSDRMRATLEGVRMSLLESQGCLSPCPNPLSGVLNIPADGLTGQSITLTYSGTDATRFEWKINDATVSNQNNYNHVFTAPGTYALELIVNNQDPNCIKKLLHTIQIKCNINADFDPKVSSIKEGSQVVFTSNTTGATEYNWKIDGVEVGNSPILNYTFDKTKDYLVQLIASNQYCSQTKSGKVIVESACGDSIWLKSYVTDKGALRLVHREGNSGSYLGAGLFLWDTKSVAVKFDANHEVLWSKYFDVLGSCEGINFNDGSSVFNVQDLTKNTGYVVKLDQLGRLVWEKELKFVDKGVNSNRIVNFLEDALIVQSGHIIRMSIDGVIKWTKYNKDFIPGSIFAAKDNSIWIIGKDVSNSETTKILNLDQNGNLIFQKQLSVNIFPKDIYQIENGDIYISFADNVDGSNFSVIKFSESGEYLSNYKQTNPNLRHENFSINNNKILLANRVLGQEVNIALLDLDYQSIWARKYKKSNTSNEISPLGFGKYKDGWLIDVFSSNNGTYENTILNVKANQALGGCYYIDGIKPVFESMPVIASSSNIQLIDGIYTEADPDISVIDLNVSSYNDCRIPNPCPKNCNEDLAHKKMIMESPSNSFIVEESVNNKLLINGFNAIDNYHFFGEINEASNTGRLRKSINSSKKLLSNIVNKDFNFEIGISENNTLILQKKDINGVVQWSKYYDQIVLTANIQMRITQGLILGYTLSKIFCIDLDGNLIWIKTISSPTQNPDLNPKAFSNDGIFWIYAENGSKNFTITKFSMNGDQVFQKSYTLNDEIYFLTYHFSVSDNLSIKAVVNTPNGRKTILTLIIKNGEILYSKEVLGDIGIYAGYSENNGYVLYHSNINQKWTFSLIDKSGNVKFTKKTSKLFNADWISQYKNGWIANCRGPEGDMLIYIFPDSQDDCILQSTDPIQLIDYPIVPTSSTADFDDITPFSGINIAPVESEELLVSFDALCTIDAPCVELCDNGIDDDDNGLTDCADPVCPCNVCENKANISIQSIDQIECQGETYKVRVTICNQGEKVSPPNMPITFYNSDPWSTNALPISTAQYFTKTVEPDSCVTQEFVLQKFAQGKIYAVVNSMPDLSTPFSTQTVFPAEDCDMTNNTLSFEYNPVSPTLDLGPDVEICYGQSVPLSAQDGFDQYRWQDFYPGKDYTAIAAGKYSITVTDMCGITQSDDIEIRLKPLAAIDLGSDKTLCKGDTIMIGLNSSDSRILLWDDGVSGIQRTVEKAGVYTLGAYSDDVCVVKDTIVISEIDRPVLDIINQKTLCEGDTFTISLPGIPGISYIWEDNSTLTERIFSQEGIYSVTASNTYCSTIDSVKIEITERPIISLQSELKKCEGDTVKVGVNPSLGLTYSWSNGQAGYEIEVSDPGSYTLTASKDGCETMSSINVIDIVKPSVKLSNDIVACEGESVKISVAAQPDVIYLWSNGKTDAEITVVESGKYTVTAKNDICESQDSINVAFLALPISSLQDSVTACQGELVTLSIDKLSQNKAVKWSDGSSDYDKAVTQSGNYNVEISNEQCKVIDTVHVVIHPLPAAIDLGVDTTICEGEVHKISIVALADHQYLWNDGISDPNRSLIIAGDYKLLITNKFGCSQSDSITLRISEMPEFDLGEDQKLCLGESIVLSPDIPVGATITWDDASDDEMRVINQQGIYAAILKYEACLVKDTVVISSDDCNPFEIIFPNVFKIGSSSNGIFKATVIGDGLNMIQYSLSVFDRWGNQIYENNDIENGWDGSLNGQNVEQGVYVYQFSIKYIKNNTEQSKKGIGTITVLK